MKARYIFLSLSIACFSVISVIADEQPSLDPVEKIFTHIYETKFWVLGESVSGPGSELRVTNFMREELSKLIKRFGITSIADAPCGDFNWMKFVDIGDCTYTGFDIVKDLIEENTRKFGETRTFKHVNLINDVIDKADMIICRDLFGHLTFEQAFAVLKNFKKSGAKYLLATTNIRSGESNHNISDSSGWFRRINLELPPFNFPRPLALIEEDVPFELERGKHLALWFLDDLDI